METSGPNAAQIEFWNDDAGLVFVEQEARIDAMLTWFSDAVLAAAAAAPGERVLDIGCGCGSASLELARRVGPTGRVLGLDLCAPMLERARENARAAGLANAEFVQVDAQTHSLPAGSIDLLFSRFGVMFFADPVAAFANLRASLSGGGRVAFVCWQAPESNQWLRVSLGAVRRFVPPDEAPAPDEPGPFSFASAERVRRVLGEAGFRDLAVTAAEGPLRVGGGPTLEEAVQFTLRVGPVAGALRDAPAAILPQAEAALRRGFEPYATENGVEFSAATWVVTARNDYS